MLEILACKEKIAHLEETAKRTTKVGSKAAQNKVNTVALVPVPNLPYRFKASQFLAKTWEIFEM